MIVARTIEEAWFQACRECMKNGYEYRIGRGSFEGHVRKQLSHLALKIVKPETRPLTIFWKGIAIATATDNQIDKYFTDYIINPDKKENEEYTYGSRIAPYLEDVIDMLSQTPGTNQATIEVGRPEDIRLEYPPCLRILSWKVIPDGLQLTSFWRSWDGRNGFPVNVGGLQLLNEFIAFESGLKSGPQVLYSDGFHIYDMSWEDFR